MHASAFKVTIHLNSVIKDLLFQAPLYNAYYALQLFQIVGKNLTTIWGSQRRIGIEYEHCGEFKP
jgi:hypothetical protein